MENSHYYVYYFIMLLGNQMVEELLSGRCILCIPGITALNRPLAAETGPSAKRGAQNKKRELMELYTIDIQHYHPLQWDKYGSSTSTQ